MHLGRFSKVVFIFASEEILLVSLDYWNKFKFNYIIFISVRLLFLNNKRFFDSLRFSQNDS
jgi:hypothetical protein